MTFLGMSLNQKSWTLTLAWLLQTINTINGLPIVSKLQISKQDMSHDIHIKPSHGKDIYSFIVYNSLSDRIIFVYSRHLIGCEMEMGDTYTRYDFVRTHYENLPYPEFSPLNVSNEEAYYRLDMETPAVILQRHTLEKHNHYLHRGDENFR